MVGLVIVSHSRALAKALVDLVNQVSSVDVPIAIAAGVGPERQEFGTDAVEIGEAIQQVYSPEGVLVIMDLGSAVLSAEMARDLLPPEMAANIRFCSAPLVEGAIAAGVQAGLGSDLASVCQEAEQALLPKKDHLGQPAEGVATPAIQPGAGETPAGLNEVVLTLHNLHGLHARPAARFVQTASAFNATVQIRNQTSGKGPVSARSLNAVATLGAIQNHQILISASGPEADQVLQSLSRLVEENFGESTEAEPLAPVVEVPVAAAQRLVAGDEAGVSVVPISEGYALGPVFRYQPPLPPIPDEKVEDPQPEWLHLMRALEATQAAIRQRRQQLLASLGEAETAIFDAHLLILQDPGLLEQVRTQLFRQHENAAAAWHHSINEVAASYEALDDPYLKQRAADVRDVGNQVLFALAGKAAAAPIEFPGPVILFAQELTPTETAQLDMSQVLGMVTVGGGPTSHSAILARALGIPAVSGVSPALEAFPTGTRLGLDGSNGRLWVDPPDGVQAGLEQRRQEWLAQRQLLLQRSHEPAATRDGHHVEVSANVGKVPDAVAAVANGAEGIGLLRTEFLYLTRETPPSEAEQVAIMRQIGEAMGDRPIIVRTIDVGGDKELPYVTLQPEANPFLGVRAIRMSLLNPDLFIVQLRAILRAGADFRFRVMFPMIANLDEVLQARQYLEQAHQALEAEKLPHRWPIETGIMVEIPSAAILSPVLAPHVDFFSIGTNDLTQYTLAAERGNPALFGLQDALHPAVLRLIGEVSTAAHAAGKWVGVCGELAGDPVAVPVLTGLGVDELSLNPGGIPRVKAVLRSIELKAAQALAQSVLAAPDAPAARKLARAFYDQLTA